jgi:hypothetical protein
LDYVKTKEMADFYTEEEMLSFKKKKKKKSSKRKELALSEQEIKEVHITVLIN